MDFLPDCEFVLKEKVPFRSIWKSFYKSLPESALLSGEYLNGIGKEREKAFDQWQSKAWLPFCTEDGKISAPGMKQEEKL